MRLRLRRHVEIEAREGGARLRDTLLQHTFEVGPQGAALVARIDGTRDVADLISAADDADVLRRLFLLNLVEGAGDAIVARAVEVLAGHLALDTSILEGARFACQGSGECCQNYGVGPLDDEDVATIAALPIAREMPHLAGVDLFDLVERDGATVRFLNSAGDRCIFLEDDARCGLHRRFGADAKPKLCRLYPIDLLVTLDGMRLVDRGSCAQFATSSRSGPTMIEDLERIRSLLRSTALDLHHPTAIVDGFPCDFGHLDRFVKAAMALVRARVGSAAETLRAIGRGARGFAAVLRGFPLEAGQPDAAISRFVEGDGASWYAAEPATPALAGAALELAEIFAALLATAGNALGREAAASSRYLGLRLVCAGAQLFHLAQAAGRRAAEPDLELDPHLRSVLAVPVADAEVDEVLRLSLRQQLFGAGALVHGELLPALLRLAIIQIMAVTGARLRAHDDRRLEARAADLSWGHMLAMRVLARGDAEAVLLARGDGAADLLEALPAILPA